MSLARSAVATAASRAYLALLSMLVLPLYLQRLGAEAYGLVALFFALQVWFHLLDAGFSTTLARESARCRAAAFGRAELRALLRAIEQVFLVALLAAGAVLVLLSGMVVNQWLRLEALEPEQAGQALRCMALVVILRLLAELYRGVVTGFEQLGWLAGFNAAIGTLRFVGVLPLLNVAGASPVVFFGYQAAVGALELAVLALRSRRLVGASGLRGWTWDLSPLRGVLPFSSAMALASVVWMLASQFDKLVLSGLLSLADYGAYGLATAAAMAVLMATGSLADVAVPRLTALQAEGQEQNVRALYSRLSQWTAVIGCSAAAWLAAHAQPVLATWTGDAALAERMAPVLALYALGNAAMALAALPYYLQLAQGRLALHLLGTGCMAALQVPGVVWAASKHGAEGAAAVWLAVNLLYLLMWSAVAHKRFATGLHLRWLGRDILPPTLAAALSAAIVAGLGMLARSPDSRLASGGLLVAAGCVILLSSAWAAPQVRADLRHGWQRARA
jgi:O-antigen/teichoic acid export membrane protein